MLCVTLITPAGPAHATRCLSLCPPPGTLVSLSPACLSRTNQGDLQKTLSIAIITTVSGDEGHDAAVAGGIRTPIF